MAPLGLDQREQHRPQLDRLRTGHDGVLTGWAFGSRPGTSVALRPRVLGLGLGHVLTRSFAGLVSSSAARAASCPLVDLGHGCHRQLGDDVEPIGCLVVGEAGATHRPEVTQIRRRGGRRRHHEGHTDLPEDGVGHPHHRDLVDAGLLAQDGLDLGGVHVVSAPDVHLRHPPDEPQIAVVTDDAQITRGDPALGVEHGPGGDRVEQPSRGAVADVAAHHRL